jgi:hypothetical protein
MADEDGDGLADLLEGFPLTDTDGDGVPDYQDHDSDDDGIGDGAESGEPACGKPAVDSDGDGQPDFRDTDSDGNGILDEDEFKGDIDNDGTGNWQDLDDDGDGMSDSLEIGPDSSDPADTDGDELPDYRDTDSDDDGILDEYEGRGDVDRDGLANFRDTDADGDGVPDGLGPEEEGRNDCDDDGLPCFLDRDSDNDGLTDAAEADMGTDRCAVDTDGDGLSDLAERAIGTDPLDGASAIGEDEYYVVLPYGEPVVNKELEFETNIKQADVYFLIDTTGSMSQELANIRESLSEYIVPEVADVVPDVQFGVGRFDDIPTGGFGGGDDVAYENIHEISGNVVAVQAAIDTFGTGGGGDGPESDVVALYCTATGYGVDPWVAPHPGCLEGRFGYPCFRPYSLPIVLLFTDFSFHNGPPDGTVEPYNLPGVPNWVMAMDALNEIGAKVLGFSSAGNSGFFSNDVTAHLTATAEATGAVRTDGTPLVFPLDSNGSGLDAAVVEAIADLATQVARDVNTQVEERPLVDDGINAADFVKSVVPLRASPEGGVSQVSDSTFVGVSAGTRLTFSVSLQNDLVQHELEPQVFVSRIVVVGDDTVRLDHRRVIVLIPPRDVELY